MEKSNSGQDTVTTQQSSIKKITPDQKQSFSVSPVKLMEVEKVPSVKMEALEEEPVESDEYAQVEEELNVPWSEIEEGWKAELKNYLVGADPDHGEEIYSAYLEEKKKFAEKIDMGEGLHGTSPGSSDEESPIFEDDGRTSELEKNHQDNLKELFGDHYPQIKSLHSEYIDSIQYINHSEVRFTIGL